MKQQILVMNGPNLNLLGTREPEVYGSESLKDIENSLLAQCDPDKVALSFFQSNAEHALIDCLHAFIEVHLSNVFSRETFRHHSYLSDIARGVITGLGSKGYGFALSYVLAQGT